jgi:hypothetical protein
MFFEIGNFFSLSQLQDHSGLKVRNTGQAVSVVLTSGVVQ